MPTPGKIRLIIGWTLSGLVALVMVASAIAKLVGPKPVLEGFEKFGLADWRIIIGIGELVSGVLFLVPRTAVLGTLLLSAYLGGAIVTNMQHAESWVFPAVLLVVVWIAAGLRIPVLFQEMLGGAPKSTTKPDRDF
jgi:DoxX-like family